MNLKRAILRNEYFQFSYFQVYLNAVTLLLENILNAGLVFLHCSMIVVQYMSAIPPLIYRHKVL